MLLWRERINTEKNSIQRRMREIFDDPNQPNLHLLKPLFSLHTSYLIFTAHQKVPWEDVYADHKNRSLFV